MSLNGILNLTYIYCNLPKDTNIPRLPFLLRQRKEAMVQFGANSFQPPEDNG